MIFHTKEEAVLAFSHELEESNECVYCLRKRIRDLQEKVASAEEYAAEGWFWVNKALERLKVETVFEI